MTQKTIYFLIILVGIHLFGSLSSEAQTSSSKKGSTYLQQLNAEEIIRILQVSPQQDLNNLHTLIINYKNKLTQTYEDKLRQVLHELNVLRNPSYQYRVWQVAKQMEGLNLYHDYAVSGSKENDDVNTCVNGWCQVMAQTGQYQLKDLVGANIKLMEGTIAKEQQKAKPNLRQAKPKYIHVQEVIRSSEKLGFLPLDLDLAQRGDFCVQYYRKTRLQDQFSAQHISVIDMVVPWGNDMFELRDWHEGVEGEPFIYRTGTNKESSHNNIFVEQNVYYGYQDNQGYERQIFTKNPNICQAYGYFGENVAQAKVLIHQINYLRGQLYMLKNLGHYLPGR